MDCRATRVLRADEALPLAAVAVDASIVCTGAGIDFIDGVGALLRYPEGVEGSVIGAAQPPARQAEDSRHRS